MRKERGHGERRKILFDCHTGPTIFFIIYFASGAISAPPQADPGVVPGPKKIVA
jgi:hypothetical protein